MSIEETSYDAMMDNIADKSTGNADKSNSRSLSIEELLKPRYLVIADYPNMEEYNFHKGLIITIPAEGFFKVKYGINCYSAFFEQFPHLFKKLEWYEERKESEMPEYVHDNTNRPKKIIRISKWHIGKDIDDEIEICADFNKKSHLMLMWAYAPATEEEYIQYQQNKEQ